MRILKAGLYYEKPEVRALCDKNPEVGALCQADTCCDALRSSSPVCGLDKL